MRLPGSSGANAVLRYNGQQFAALCCDASPTITVQRADPTGTQAIRSALASHYAVRLRRVVALLRQQLVANDLLGLHSQTSATALLQMQAIASNVDRVELFNSYVRDMLRAQFEDDDMLRQQVAKAYARGVSFAETFAHAQPALHVRQAQIAFFVSQARNEIDGIAAATIQQVNRTVGNGLLARHSASNIVRHIGEVIEKVGVKRTALLAEDVIVRTFTNATLDAYAQAGITQVGVLAENVVARAMQDARKVKRPGSRTRRRTPSRSTIYRIEQLERGLEQSLGQWVEVVTAGDNKVCPICEELEAIGVMPLDTARSLVPAHPRCRCALLPAAAPRKPSKPTKAKAKPKAKKARKTPTERRNRR